MDSVRPRGYLRRTEAAAQESKNSTRSAATTVAPTGVDQAKEISSPTQKHTTAVTAAQRMTPRKLLNRRMAVRAGKMTKEEINKRGLFRGSFRLKAHKLELQVPYP